jgi:hypothetical protein
MWRAVAAGVSVVLAAVIGVVTALVTAHPSLGLWVALGVVVVAGAGLQAAVTYSERSKTLRVRSAGAGAVAIGGSARGPVQTHVHGSHVQSAGAGEQDGVTASGPGAVSIGGDMAAQVSTDVTGEAEQHDDQA